MVLQMTTDPIAARVSFRHLQHNVEDEKAVLLIPCTVEKKVITPSTVENTVWLKKIESFLQEASDLGLFGMMKINNVVDKAFRSANDGWCRAVSDYFLVLRDPRARIEEIVKKIFSDPERLCFAQLCYEFDIFLKHAISFVDLLENVCNLICRCKPIPDYVGRIDRIISQFLKGLREACRTKKFSKVTNKEFIAEKKRLISQYFVKPIGKAGGSIFDKLVVLSDEGKIAALRELQKKIHHFREEVLGGPLPSPAVTVNTNAELMKYCSSLSPRILQVVTDQTPIFRHIYTYFIHQGKRYKLDTASGLSEIKMEKPCMSPAYMNKKGHNICEYRLFYR